MLAAGAAFQSAYWMGGEAGVTFDGVSGVEYVGTKPAVETTVPYLRAVNAAARRAGADMLKELREKLYVGGRPVPRDSEPMLWDCLERLQAFVTELNAAAADQDEELQRWEKEGGAIEALTGESFDVSPDARALAYNIKHKERGLPITREWLFTFERVGDEWKVTLAVDPKAIEDQDALARAVREQLELPLCMQGA